jgi:hypothetical protein
MREQEQYRGLQRCASGAPATEAKTVHGQLYRRAITKQENEEIDTPNNQRKWDPVLSKETGWE